MIGILTDLGSRDVAYSLYRVIKNQVRLITDAGYACRVFTREPFHQFEAFAPAEVVNLDHGEIGDNAVKVTDRSVFEIAHLAGQLREHTKDINVLLTHDLIYQANLWRAHVACRRLAKDRPDLHWYHWVHSATTMHVKEQTKQFQPELEGPFPNATLVVMHEEERERKRNLYGYPSERTVIIPNPCDFTADYHPAALEAIEAGRLWDADVIAVYPCRLDRGKQPHVLIEIFAELAAMGWDARVIIVDFHSTGGDKAIYRDEMKALAAQRNVQGIFTSDLSYPGANYEIPHKAVMDLFNFADVLVHPSVSESDPLILPEAAWHRNCLVLNYDLPLFRMYQGQALYGKFSSAVDVTTGEMGETKTEYGDRAAYMRMIAANIAHEMGTNPVLAMHANVRRTRSLKTVWEKHLLPSIGRHGPLQRFVVKEDAFDEMVSIVVPCWLVPDEGDYGEDELFVFTQACFASIREHMPYAELIVVDNGSTVHADWLLQQADKYIRNEENKGFAPAVNQGLAAASGDWLLVVNNDLEFIDDWARRAIREWHENSGIVCSHNLAHDVHQRVGREVPPDPIGYFFGACWMISRAVYKLIGGMDEEYTYGMGEDKALVAAIIAQGMEMFKVGHVRHIGNASWGKLSRYGVDTGEVYKRNMEKLKKDWNYG